MMNKPVAILLVMFFALLPCLLQAESFTAEITAEQWAIPRHGERVLKMSGIKKVMQQWHKNTQQSIEISYPGGESGELWLTELRDWLIALGVSSVKIKSIAGSGSKDIIKLTVVAAEGVTE